MNRIDFLSYRNSFSSSFSLQSLSRSHHQGYLGSTYVSLPCDSDYCPKYVIRSVVRDDLRAGVI